MRVKRQIDRASAELLPPCDMDSECLLVGAALLLGPFPDVEPKHFFFDCTRRTYQALLGNDAHPLERWLVRAARKLHSERRLLQVGGTRELVRMMPDDFEQLDEENLRVHAEVLVERWRKRVVAEAANQLAAELRGEKIPAAEAWRRFKDICERAAA